MKIMKFIPYGIENAISQEELAIRMKCDKRTVRALIFNARRMGMPICSTCKGIAGGYYLPLSADEAIPYIKMQLNRLDSTMTALLPVLRFTSQCKKGNNIL